MIPADGDFTLYHLRTRTFWSQITTIWEWFIANFDSESLAQGHDRPVWIYTIADNTWSGPKVIEAWVALEPPLLTFADTAVDRSNQAWLSAADGDSRDFDATTVNPATASLGPALGKNVAQPLYM
ncbi:MAG: hypothetical protein E2O50_06610, partial [Gammaproteobacteria bacterium]